MNKEIQEIVKEVLENSPPEEAEETIMDKALRHYNFVQSKKKADIEDGFLWSNDKNSVKIPPYKPIKVERNRVGWRIFFRNLLKEIRP